jgi:hypothetical protein
MYVSPQSGHNFQIQKQRALSAVVIVVVWASVAICDFLAPLERVREKPQATSYPATQENPNILWRAKFRRHVQKSPPLVQAD